MNRFFGGLILCTILVTPALFAQSSMPAPKQERLLNGLKILMWPDAKADKVSIKLRIHSGSGFDPQGKEGLMQMLADNLFPNEATSEFFTEDLGGSLEVVTNYDYIQVNASSKPEPFLTMIETIATAVSNPVIDKETTAKLRTALLAKVASLESDPTYVADQAVAKRLFGSFPYGRPQNGAADSLKKIDFPDLIDAKQRFLTADNATIALSGNFDKAAALRAIRRYFGGWTKSDKLAPATFRQPEAPDTKPFGVTISGTGNSEVRYALRGLARNEKDYAASQIVSNVVRSRLQNQIPKNSTNPTVENHAYLLPGIFIVGYTSGPTPAIAMAGSTGSSSSDAAMPQNLPQNIISIFLLNEITSQEFTTAKAVLVDEMNRRLPADWWLDADTYKINSLSDDQQAFKDVTLADVRRIAERLSKSPAVTIWVMQKPAAPSN